MVSIPSAFVSNAGVFEAWLRSICAASAFAYALLVSSLSGFFTNAGSPSFVFRSMNARRKLSASRCAYFTLPAGGSGAKFSRMFSASVIVMPPDDDGGIASSV